MVFGVSRPVSVLLPVSGVRKVRSPRIRSRNKAQDLKLHLGRRRGKRALRSVSLASTVFGNSCLELKTARTLQGTRIWREPSDTIKVTGVEGTASTRELTLFSCFFPAGGYELVNWELHSNITGASLYRLVYTLRTGKSVSGMKKRAGAVSVSELRCFGVFGLDEIVGLAYRGSGNYIPNRAVLTAFTLFTTTDQPAISTTACVGINCGARSEYLSRWRHLSCRRAYHGNGLKGNLQGVYAHESASEKECVLYTAKNTIKRHKKRRQKWHLKGFRVDQG